MNNSDQYFAIERRTILLLNKKHNAKPFQLEKLIKYNLKKLNFSYEEKGGPAI